MHSSLSRIGVCTVLFTLFVTACSSAEVTVESMNEAVTSAAASVAEGQFEAVTVEGSQSGDVLRSEWLDFRSNKDFRQLFGSRVGDDVSVLGWVVTDGDRWCATSGSGDACAFDVAVDQGTWASYGPVTAPAGETKQILDVVADGFVQRRVTASGIEAADLRRENLDDGSTLWTLAVPLAGGVETWEWTVGADGVLDQIVIRGDGVLALDRFAQVEMSFTLLQNPPAFEPPVPGTEFDAAKFPLPDDAPLLTP